MASFDDHEFDLVGSGIELRTAGPDDQDLARRVVALAANWRQSEVPHELSDDVHKYFADWGRSLDIGVMAFCGIEFVGGAHVRQFGPADGAYGFVDAGIPELSIGVEAGYRRRGIAVILLAALKAKVIEAGLPGISLSVEPDNGARHLYTRMGFELIEHRANDLLMVWRR